MKVKLISQETRKYANKVIDKSLDKTIKNFNFNNDIKKDNKYDEDEVKKAIDKLNKLFEDKSTHVEYEVYGKFNDITISIIDDNTNSVIKEIPPKKLIDMVDKLCELAGMFVDDKV